jgi:hypothetical protein
MKAARKLKDLLLSFFDYLWGDLYFNQEKNDFERLKRFISS